MITPRFKLDQTDEYLLIDIRVPYAKVIIWKFFLLNYLVRKIKWIVFKLNEVDMFVESNDFRFYCKPYYLRWVEIFTKAKSQKLFKKTSIMFFFKD